MTGTLSRPNSNYVLSIMRDHFDNDPWGTAMSWAGSACDVLYDADANEVPAGLQYSPGMGGPEVPNGALSDVHRITLDDVPYETVTLWCWLHNVDPNDPAANDPDQLLYWEDAGFRDRANELRTALLCLDRYLDWCKSAGLAY